MQRGTVEIVISINYNSCPFDAMSSESFSTAGAVRVETNLPKTSGACPIFFVLQMHSEKMFDLENEGQRHGAQQLQWSHSMANINLYKSHSCPLSLTLTVCKVFTFQISLSWKWRLKSWCTTIVIAPFDAKYRISCLLSIVMFAVFPIETCQNSKWSWKFR